MIWGILLDFRVSTANHFEQKKGMLQQSGQTVVRYIMLFQSNHYILIFCDECGYRKTMKMEEIHVYDLCLRS